jgi:hypothetical protein
MPQRGIAREERRHGNGHLNWDESCEHMFERHDGGESFCQGGGQPITIKAWSLGVTKDFEVRPARGSL